jgi:hypothetical protein
VSSAPGVLLEDEEADLQVVIDKPEPNFVELATSSLNYAGIDASNHYQAAQQATLPHPGPALIEANDDAIMYEITSDMPDAGLVPNNVVPAAPTPPGDTTVNNLAYETFDILTDMGDSMRQYPTQLYRSVTGYTPQTTFLQLGVVQVHRGVINTMRNAKATKEERVHATTWTGTSMTQDNMEYVIDKDLVMQSEDEFKIWAYVMTQYNLKPGLCKFGKRGVTAAVDELTQLHIMDTWTAMDPSKISREEQMKALSSLLFLKEKLTGKIKGQACINDAPQRA